MFNNNEKLILIGFSGLKQSGKTTAANLLNIETEFLKLSFAEPVKKIASLMGWNGQKDENGRKILQILGTDIGRNLINKNIWINHMEEILNKLRNFSYGTLKIVIDDVRFDNEVEWINNHGGKVINIIRPGNIDLTETHSSEQGISPEKVFRLVINDTTLDQFKRKIKHIFLHVLNLPQTDLLK